MVRNVDTPQEIFDILPDKFHGDIIWIVLFIHSSMCVSIHASTHLLARASINAYVHAHIHTSYHPSHITRARVQLIALTSRPNCAALGGLSKKVANAFTTSACKARCPRLDLRKATTAAFSAPDSATISLAALRRRLEERAAPLC